MMRESPASYAQALRLAHYVIAHEETWLAKYDVLVMRDELEKGEDAALVDQIQEFLGENSDG